MRYFQSEWIHIIGQYVSLYVLHGFVNQDKWRNRKLKATLPWYKTLIIRFSPSVSHIRMTILNIRLLRLWGIKDTVLGNQICYLLALSLWYKNITYIELLVDSNLWTALYLCNGAQRKHNISHSFSFLFTKLCTKHQIG